MFNNIHTTFQISSKRDITLEFRNNLLLNWNDDLCMCNFQFTPLSFVLSHCHTNIFRIQTYIMQYVFYLYIYILVDIIYHLYLLIYTVRQNLSTTWLVSIISFLIMNLFQIGFAIFFTCTHILTCLWNRLLIDFYLCVYDRVCKVPRGLFNICVCEF